MGIAYAPLTESRADEDNIFLQMKQRMSDITKK